jgi:hypothetical protein
LPNGALRIVADREKSQRFVSDLAWTAAFVKDLSRWPSTWQVVAVERNAVISRDRNLNSDRGSQSKLATNVSSVCLDLL